MLAFAYVDNRIIIAYPFGKKYYVACTSPVPPKWSYIGESAKHAIHKVVNNSVIVRFNILSFTNIQLSDAGYYECAVKTEDLENYYAKVMIQVGSKHSNYVNEIFL